MQQTNTSNKKRKAAERTPISAGVNAAAEQPAPKRVARTSKSKGESSENTVASHERTQTSVAEAQPVTEALAAVPVTETVKASAVAEVPLPSSADVTRSSSEDVTTEDIARLAHSFWAARGYQHGSAEEDWFRAERQLRKTAAAHA